MFAVEHRGAVFVSRIDSEAWAPLYFLTSYNIPTWSIQTSLRPQAGAEVDAQAKSGVTALWLAAGEGRKDVLEELLKNGASASNSRSDGITALMGAAAGGHADAVNMLLAAGEMITVRGTGHVRNSAPTNTLPFCFAWTVPAYCPSLDPMSVLIDVAQIFPQIFSSGSPLNVSRELGVSCERISSDCFSDGIPKSALIVRHEPYSLERGHLN